MPASPKPSASASVIFAAVIAVLAALFTLLVAGFGFLGILLGTGQASSPEFPPFVKNVALAMMAFMACLAAFGFATGIGLMRLRNWARISVLIWGGLCVFFGVFGVAAAFVMPLAPPPNAPNVTEASMHAVRFIILGVYGLPLAVGIWWLILFNRKAVKEQFTAAAGLLDAASPQKPRCPIPVAIFAWLFITSAAHVVILPFLPFSMPLILFGRLFSGPIATSSYALICVIFIVCGIGLLRLKRWSYPLTLGIQLFFLASAIVTVLNPNYPAQIASLLTTMNTAMHLPPNPLYTVDNLQHMRWAMYMGFLIPVVTVGILFYCRERFMQAASAASSSARPLPS